MDENILARGPLKEDSPLQARDPREDTITCSAGTVARRVGARAAFDPIIAVGGIVAGSTRPPANTASAARLPDPGAAPAQRLSLVHVFAPLRQCARLRFNGTRKACNRRGRGGHERKHRQHRGGKPYPGRSSCALHNAPRGFGDPASSRAIPMRSRYVERAYQLIIPAYQDCLRAATRLSRVVIPWPA